MSPFLTDEVSPELSRSPSQGNTAPHEWYIGSYSMQSPGAPDRVSVICLMHDARHFSEFYQFSHRQIYQN